MVGEQGSFVVWASDVASHAALRRVRALVAKKRLPAELAEEVREAVTSELANAVEALFVRMGSNLHVGFNLDDEDLREPPIPVRYRATNELAQELALLAESTVDVVSAARVAAHEVEEALPDGEE